MSIFLPSLRLKSAALLGVTSVLSLVSWVSSQSNNRALAWKHVETGSWEADFLHPWASQPPIEYTRYDIEMDHLPHNGSYTAAIYWVTGANKLWQTLASLESVARHVPMEQQYTYIMLHDGELSLPAQIAFRERWLDRAHTLKDEPLLAAKMRAMLPSLEFYSIELQIPDDLARRVKNEGYEDIVFDHRWPGYHSMCRFNSVNVFWHPRIREFDYFMRLDSDSYITSPMPEDPFRRLRNAGARYAWISSTFDEDWVTKGMWQLADKYATECDVPGVRERVDANGLVQGLKEGTQTRIGSYETNFEVVHVPSFRRKDVADWLDVLRRDTDGFYRYRWGDSPLRFVTVHMFFNESDLVKFNDFGYHHQRMFPRDP